MADNGVEARWTDAEEIARAADRISALILYSDLPWIDIELSARELRRQCRARFPERPYLFDWIYAPRFRRLWDQWRVTR